MGNSCSTVCREPTLFSPQSGSWFGYNRAKCLLSRETTVLPVNRQNIGTSPVPAFLNVIMEPRTDRVPCCDIVTIGRDGSNTITIPDPRISRNHAMIRCLAPEQYYLFDVGSRNGCFINGLRIRTPTLLKQGDVINLGDATLTFEQFIVPDAEHMHSGEGLAETIRVDSSDVRFLAIMVADIRGYTRLSERLSIKVLSEMMAKWYDMVQKIVEGEEGMVDKFIGDCVMAIWDVDQEPKQKVLKCLRSAFKIHSFTKELDKTYSEIPEEMKIGVGINTGEAVVGVGADHTAMGDTVNLAFRLETATKPLKCDLVLSESTYHFLPKELWEGREHSIEVKGKSGKINVCALHLSQNMGLSIA